MTNDDNDIKWSVIQCVSQSEKTDYILLKEHCSAKEVVDLINKIDVESNINEKGNIK